MRNALLGIILLTGLIGYAEDNPIYRLFPQDILFHLSFDDGRCFPEMASGKAEPVRPSTITYGKGVFGGQALRTGRAYFSADQNIDFLHPGTIICWIAADGWSNNVGKNDKGLPYTPIQVYGDDFQFVMGKMGGQPKQAQHMNFYFYLHRQNPAKVFSCTNFDTAGFPGKMEWKMLVATWQGTSFGNAVNKKHVHARKPVLKKQPHTIAIGNSEKVQQEYPLLVDEIVFLNRSLTKDEINLLFEESQKIIHKQE